MVSQMRCLPSPRASQTLWCRSRCQSCTCIDDVDKCLFEKLKAPVLVVTMLTNTFLPFWEVERTCIRRRSSLPRPTQACRSTCHRCTHLIIFLISYLMKKVEDKALPMVFSWAQFSVVTVAAEVVAFTEVARDHLETWSIIQGRQLFWLILRLETALRQN